jgi:hypothetical protein
VRALPVFTCVVTLACAHGEPPQWDAGAGASLALAALPGTDAASLAASATPTPTEAGTPAPPDAGSAPSGEDSGKLPQTHDEPQPSGPAFDAGVRALWDGIAQDDPDRALPFFFPLSAYRQVKAIANPTGDWRARLVGHYARDIHALHAKLAPQLARAHFVSADVPMDRARWVEPGEEYNKIGYWRVYGTKLRGATDDGAPIVVDVTSLISWRGEWFVVHLTGVK